MVMKVNILITSAGRRVSLVRAFQNELKKIYPNGKVIAVDARPELSAACMVADYSFKVPKVNVENYIQELFRICLENSVGMVIPTIDTELLILSQNKLFFNKNKINVIVSDEAFIRICRNKRLTHNFFISKGIEVAKEYDKNNYTLPLFIKPIDGSRSIDTFIIKDKKDINDYHLKNDKLLFLEYLDQKEHIEYTCDIYYGRDSKLKCVIPRKRIEIRDGEVNKAKTEKNILVSHIKKHLYEINGAIGCLTAQFFYNKKNNRIIGIEINPRFGGGAPLSYLAGGNFPKLLIEEYYQNKKIKYFDDWEDNLLMLRYDDEILVHDYEG